MQLIAGGRKDHRAVVEEWMGIMREVYKSCYDRREAMHVKLAEVFNRFDASRWQRMQARRAQSLKTNPDLHHPARRTLRRDPQPLHR